MPISADSIGLLFRAKGDTDDAKKAFGELRTSIDGDVNAIETKGKTGFSGLAQSMGLSEGAAAGLATGVAVAAAAIAAAAAVAVSLSVSLFNLTKSASEYGSEIKDAQDKTGLAASTLTTLKYAADNAGSSLETVTSGTAKFAKLIGQAAEGNVTAQKTLKDLGVTSKDLNTALGEVSKTIFEAKDGTEQIVIAQKAFGKSGADLIPVIKQFGGDLAAAQKEAERLGITLTEKDIQASDAFGDALGLLGSQAKSAAVAFTSDLMPVMTRFFTYTSEWYARNQDEVRLWGFAVARTLEYAVGVFSKAFKTIGDDALYLREIIAGLTLGISELVIAAAKMTREGFKRQYDNQVHDAGGGGGTSAFTPTLTGGKGKGGKSDAQKEAEKQAKEDLKAQLDLQKLALKQLEDEYKETLKHIREEFKKTADDNALVNAADAALTKFKEGTQVANDLLNDLERQAAGPQTENQEKLTTQQQMERVRTINAFIASEVDATNKLIVDSDQKAADKRLQISQKITTELASAQRKLSDNAVKTTEEAWDKQIADLQGFTDEQNRIRGEAYNDLVILFTAQRDGRLQDLDIEYQAEKTKIEKEVQDKTQQLKLLADLDELYKAKALLTEEEFQKQKQEIEDKYAIPITPGDDTGGTGFFSGLVKGLGTSIDDMLKKVEPLKGIGQIVGSQFQAIAQGVGNAVKAFVLFGSAGGSVRKFAAEIIASVAQMATVQAIWELAQGFAMLALTYFTGNPKYAASAGAHFTAAAIYGVVAGAAVIAGRVTAGDSFKKESSGAYGTAPGGSGSNSGQGRPNDGGVYSGKEDQIVETGRNASGGLHTNVTLTIHDKSDWFAQMFKVEMSKNGLVRQLVQDAG